MCRNVQLGPFPVPAVAVRVSLLWKRVQIKRLEQDHLYGERWIALKHLFRSRSLGKHMGKEVHRNPRVFEHRSRMISGSLVTLPQPGELFRVQCSVHLLANARRTTAGSFAITVK